MNTGTVRHFTQFLVPIGAATGPADITVVANGIASDPVPVIVSSIKKIEIKELKVELGGSTVTLSEGDWITIDGSTGEGARSGLRWC